MPLTTPLVERYWTARRDPGLAVLEGLHALKHALRFGAEVVAAHVVEPDVVQRLAERLAPDVAETICERAEPVDRETFSQLSPRPHATGVIALARRPVGEPQTLLRQSDAPMVLLERPTHHGNIGAVVRVAAAAGAAGVLSTGPHDPWHPAALRGSAGLHFAVPVTAVEPPVETERKVVALDPEGQQPRSLPRGALLVFGSERAGVSQEMLERADIRVRIPMRRGVSSLNLATSVAVVLYTMNPLGPES